MASAGTTRKFLPESLVVPATQDDIGAVVPYFRAAVDRLYLRELQTGRTIFHLACMSPKPHLLRELLDMLAVLGEKGVSILNDLDYDGCHAMHLCVKHDHLEHLDLMIRQLGGPDGRPLVRFPLVDNLGRSVASYTRAAIDWSIYGSLWAELFTRPQPATAPRDFGLDDVVLAVTLKKPFQSTPLPWRSLPVLMTVESSTPESKHAAMASAQGTAAALVVAPVVVASAPTHPVDASPKLPMQDPDAMPAPQQPPLAPTPSLALAPSLSGPSFSSPLVAPLSPTQLANPVAGSTEPRSSPNAACAAASTLVSDCYAQLLFLPSSTSTVQQSTGHTTTGGTTALVAAASGKSVPILVGQMICLRGEFQFGSEVFFHDTMISGPLTVRATPLYVDYYRCVNDPDVLLSKWHTPSNPDVCLFVCRRIVRRNHGSPKAGASGSTPSKRHRLRRVITALDASADLFKRSTALRTVVTSPKANGSSSAFKPSPSASLAPDGSLSDTHSTLALTRGSAFLGPEASVGGFAEEPQLQSSDTAFRESERSRSVTHPDNENSRDDGDTGSRSSSSGSDEQDDQLSDMTVPEAVGIVVHVFRQVMLENMRRAVCLALRKIFVVKRFVREAVRRRTRCVNMFFARLIPVLEAVRRQLAAKRIIVNAQEGTVLACNVPSTTALICARRSIRRKDGRWHIAAGDVFARMAPLVVGAPDLQATLQRMLMDEWLLPTAERERLLAAQQAEESRTPQPPPRDAGGRSSARRKAHPAVRCTPHSPIPTITGTSSDVRAMLIAGPYFPV